MAKVYPLGTDLFLEEDSTYFYIKNGGTTLIQINKSTTEWVSPIFGEFVLTTRIVYGGSGDGSYIELPRMTNAQKALLTPQEGTLVYSTDDQKAQVYVAGITNDWVNLM